MKTRQKGTNSHKMWIEQVTVKFNDGPEMEVELELANKAIYIHYHDSHIYMNYIRIIDCIQLDEGEIVDIVHLLYRGDIFIQFRFGSSHSKSIFLESALRPRDDDSGNSTERSTPSSPHENQ